MFHRLTTPACHLGVDPRVGTVPGSALAMDKNTWPPGPGSTLPYARTSEKQVFALILVGKEWQWGFSD